METGESGSAYVSLMPELPEVEILRRHLQPLLAGRRVADVLVSRPRAVRPGTPEALASAMRGARFADVGRRGKFLLFALVTRGKARKVVGHLGMTGRMYLEPSDAPRAKHEAVSIALDDGHERLVFEDPRGFGRFTTDRSSVDALGPEPWDESLDAGGFAGALRGTRRAIKIVFLDQSVVAGIGNIYASEALFLAGIAPGRAANTVTANQAKRLLDAIRVVLEAAIASGSKATLDFASGSDGLFYHGSAGEGPKHDERFRVYDREGEPCPRCRSPIRRSVDGGRSSFWCAKCQA